MRHPGSPLASRADLQLGVGMLPIGLGLTSKSATLCLLARVSNCHAAAAVKMKIDELLPKRILKEVSYFSPSYFPLEKPP